MTWSNGLGHINTFNTEGFQSRTQNEYKTYSTALQNYYATLKTRPDSISQFNHPGTTFGDFSDFAYYDEEIDKLTARVRSEVRVTSRPTSITSARWTRAGILLRPTTRITIKACGAMQTRRVPLSLWTA